MNGAESLTAPKFWLIVGMAALISACATQQPQTEATGVRDALLRGETTVSVSGSTKVEVGKQ